ncbi:hypothetical protein ANRL1_01827 [Anaerolineae bacterium]|nr:hypothetical protein ANRL1_01827 [Anaerolineae bacterium]
MSTETVIDSEFVTMWYYPADKIVHHKFHKFIFGEAFRETLSTGAVIFEKRGATKWLSDDRNNGAIPQEDTDWSNQNWLPRVMKAGWKYWALILPEKAVGQMNMQRFVKQFSEMGLTVQVFDDPDKALKWLKSV